VKADGELTALELAKKTVKRKYPDGKIELLEVLKSD